MIRDRARNLLAVLAALGCTLGLRAQDERSVRVRVTSVSARSLYLDGGRAAGLAPGQEVELMPPNGAPFLAPIREVSATSARAELPPGRPLVPVGTIGEVRLRPGDGSGAEPSAPKRAGGVPEHPPWTLDEFPRDRTDEPLLAPAFGGGPASRPIDWDGRLFGQLQYARDDAEGRGFESYRARLGARLEVTNLFGAGGRLGFDGEVRRRGVDLFDGGEDSDDQLRIDRASYAIGDDDLEPWRVEIGRFVSQHAPELGLLDGAEVLRRLSPDFAVGGGLGLFPLPFPDRNTGDDAGLFGFVQWRPTAEPRLGGTVGFQKTWHEGAPDRDLMFARADWTPSDELRIDASALVDFYTGKDDLKDSAAELTQAWLSTTWNPTDDLGLGLSATTYSWAQLLREDLAFAPPELIRDGRVTRISPRVFVDLGPDFRVQARADFWSDQERDGSGGEIGFDWYRVLGTGLDLGLAAFHSEGSYLSGPGLRARAARSFDWGWTGLRYEWTNWSADGLSTGSEDFGQHRLGLDVDLAIGARWNALFNGEVILGDDQDALTLGIFVQRRF
jgi:hypothetical protein